MKKIIIMFVLSPLLIMCNIGFDQSMNMPDDTVVIDFNEFSTGEFSRSELRDFGYSVSTWDNNLKKHSNVNRDGSGNQYLSVYTPQGTYGTKTSGVQFEIELAPADAYYMSYDFMFDEDFSFGQEYQGGKLPGLTSGNRCSKKCDGTDGFAARFMWRQNGLAELYLCNVDKKSQYCDDYYFRDNDGNNIYFERNHKYHIEEYVRINSGPNNFDGQIIIYLDGQEVINLNCLRLVTDSDQIDTFYFSTFHGGSTNKWAASNDSYIYFDNLYIERAI